MARSRKRFARFKARKRNHSPTKRSDMASDLEFTHWAKALKLAKKYKAVLKYESEKLGYVLEKNYVPDFVFYFPDGRTMYLEIKGYFRPQDRTKLLAVKKKDPSLDIRLVFAKDNKINSKTKTTYSDWCRKNGFVWSVGFIPKEWFYNEKQSKSRSAGPAVPQHRVDIFQPQ